MKPNHPDPPTRSILERSINVSVVRGVLTTDVRVSDLPAGGVVHNFEVKAASGGERHLVPVAWHDPVRPPRLRQGDEVVVVGAVRRRWFRAGGVSQSRTELLATCVAKPSSEKARRGLTGAVDTIHSLDLSGG